MKEIPAVGDERGSHIPDLITRRLSLWLFRPFGLLPILGFLVLEEQDLFGMRRLAAALEKVAARNLAGRNLFHGGITGGTFFARKLGVPAKAVALGEQTFPVER